MADIIQKIINWAEKENLIQAIVLLGSRASNNLVDAFSDYDISIFCNSYEPYITSQGWLKSFGKALICVKEKISFNEKIFPTRLVIFEDGVKIDFSFFTLDVLNFLESYDKDYKVLLDKNGTTKNLKKPSFKAPLTVKPSEEEFLEVINEFWLEAYHVGIYLKRKDLWSVKFRSNNMHTFLLKMIQWQAQVDTPPIGRHMDSWTSETIWKELHGVFAHFDTQDSQKALLHTLKLFRRLSIDLAQKLNFTYPESLDNKMTTLVIEK